MLEQIGFTNVTQMKHTAPLSPWAPDPESRRLGELSQAVILQVLRPFTLSTVVAGGLWTLDELDHKLADVRREILDLDLRAYVPMYACGAILPPPRSNSRVDRRRR